MDTLIAHFPEPASAERAVEELLERGFDSDRTGTHRAVETPWRGLDLDDEEEPEGGGGPYSREHDPYLEDTEVLQPEMGYAVVTVDLSGDDDPAEVEELLLGLGAVRVELAEATDPDVLDL